NIFMADNFHTENAAGSRDNSGLLWCADSLAKLVLLKEAYPMFAYNATAPGELYENVLTSAGAILPVRDAVDSRILEEIRTGTGRIINSQNDVGGWPAYS